MGSSNKNNDAKRPREMKSLRKSRSNAELGRKTHENGNLHGDNKSRLRRRKGDGALDSTDLSIIDESATLQIPKVSRKRSHEDLCDLGAR